MIILFRSVTPADWFPSACCFRQKKLNMLLLAHPCFRPFDQLSRLAPMAPGNTFLPYFLSGEGS